MEWAGKDATKAFRDANHSMSAMNTRDLYYIGEL
jgi:cytochrome b involved in lipid metabolism